MNKLTTILIFFCYLFTLVTAAQPGKGMLKSDWLVFSENNDATELRDTLYQGKSSMRLDGKKQVIAYRKDLSMKNFRIDVDIAGEVMSGIGFRAADHQNYEFLYFRPGNGGTKEAIQYVPIYNGALSWVLYNYPVYETNADIKRLEWFHVRMEIRGSNLKVFVNSSQTAQMDIQLIGSEFNEGGILLRSMFGTSWFSNVAIRPLPESLNDWEISEQFTRKQTFDFDNTIKPKTWTKVKTDQADIVNLCRYFKHPNGVIMARHNLKAEDDQDLFLLFDFIGKLRIYLNGSEIFFYEKFKLDRIFAGTHQIVLNLKKGNNELLFISEGDAAIFGKGFNSMGRTQHQNWGFVTEVIKK